MNYPLSKYMDITCVICRQARPALKKINLVAKKGQPWSCATHSEGTKKMDDGFACFFFKK